MRTLIGICLAWTAVFGAVAQASDNYAVERVKTGILPSGGFYRMYTVDCPDQFTGAVASLNDQRRWCTLNNGEMDCFTRRQDASYSACSSGAVAATNENIDGVGNYQ